MLFVRGVCGPRTCPGTEVVGVLVALGGRPVVVVVDDNATARPRADGIAASRRRRRGHGDQTRHRDVRAGHLAREWYMTRYSEPCNAAAGALVTAITSPGCPARKGSGIA